MYQMFKNILSRQYRNIPRLAQAAFYSSVNISTSYNFEILELYYCLCHSLSQQKA